MSLNAYAHLHQPPAQAGGPTVLLAHGTGGTKETIAPIAAEIAPGAGVLALDGDVLEGGARRFFRRRAEGVYDMEDLSARTDQFERFVSEASDAYDLAPDRLIGLGYSNGANILASLALTGSPVINRYVLMHPLIPFAPDAPPDLAGRRVLITAGERDPICPPDATKALREQLVRYGAAVEVLWTPGGHEVRPEELRAAASFIAA